MKSIITSIFICCMYMVIVPAHAAINATLTVTAQGVPICKVNGESIALFIAKDNISNEAEASFSANVNIESDKEEEVKGVTKKYKWTAGDLKVLDDTKPTCRVLVSELDHWGRLYTVTCTVTLTKEDETKTLTKQHKAATPLLKVSEIHFNHDTESHQKDAMNLNKVFMSQTIKAPEFILNSNQPFLYSGGITPTIKVKIKLLPDILKNGRVDVEQDDSNEANSDMNLIGALKPENFISDDLTSFVAQQALPDKVDKKRQAWIWHLTHIEGIALPPKRVSREVKTAFGYLILKGDIHEPWSQIYDDSFPWVSVLDFTIDKCNIKGFDSREKILTGITSYLYGSHGLIYRLDESINKKYAYTNREATQCLMFFDEYCKKIPELPVNCVDQTAALTMCSTLIGVKALHQSITGWYPLDNSISLVGISNRPLTAFIMHRICEYNNTWSDATLGKLNAKALNIAPIVLYPKEKYVQHIVDPNLVIPNAPPNMDIDYHPKPNTIKNRFLKP